MFNNIGEQQYMFIYDKDCCAQGSTIKHGFWDMQWYEWDNPRALLIIMGSGKILDYTKGLHNIKQMIETMGIPPIDKII